MHAKPVLFGADYSVYVRIARLALIEKGVDHDIVPVDVFSADGLPEGYAARHPFGRIPSLDHGGFRVFETSAITRYVDEAFDGPALQPDDAEGRAVMNQIIGVIDSYAYKAMVWDIYVERVSRAGSGETPDEDLIAAALPVAMTCLETFETFKSSRQWLAGETIGLADFHLAPVFAYFLQAPEGRTMLGGFPALAAWWTAISERASFKATAPSRAE